VVSDDAIVECCLVRDYKGRLLAFRRLEKLQIKLDNAHERGVQKEIHKLEAKMEKLQAKSSNVAMNPTDRNVCKRAYVMFNSCESQELLLNFYRFGNFSLFRKFQRAYMRFEGRALQITRAPEPNDIMWENQDRKELRVFIQKLLTLLLALIMFAISFVLIFASKAYTKNLQEKIQDCVTRIEPVTLETWQTDLPMDTCKCQEIGLSGVAGVYELRNDHCKEWFEDDVKLKLLMAAGAIIVVLVNLLLQTAVHWFTQLEQPLSVSAFNASLAVKIGVAQFLNTGIIVLLVNSTLFQFTNLMGNSGLNDFDREWYRLVGKALIITLMIQAFSPHLVQVFAVPFLKCMRRCSASGKKTQRDLNALYTWPHFNLAVRLGALMNVLLCTLVYSGGLPLLSLIAAVTFFLVYQCDKYLLLRASRMPPAYSESLLLIFLKVVPIACFAHTCFAIYMFGNQDVFPGPALIPDLDRTNPNNKLDDLGGIFKVPVIGEFFERCLVGASTGNFVLWLLLVVLLALTIVRVIMGATFGTVLQACAALCCARRVAPDALEAQETALGRRQEAQNTNRGFFGYAPDMNPLYAGLIAQANAGVSWKPDS